MKMRTASSDPERQLYVRAADCGRALSRGGADVDVDWHEGKRLAAIPGASCEWGGCPVCGRAIRARKASEITLMAAEWEKRGGQLVMLTIAPPHHRGDDLDVTWKSLQRVWDLVVKDRVGKAWHHRWGIRGQAVSIEATVCGANGDHPHRHALLFLERTEGEPRADPDELAGDLFASLIRWKMRARGDNGKVLDGWGMAGFQAVEAGPSAGRYVAKLTELDADDWDQLAGLGAEMTDTGAAKVSRGASGGVSVTAICAAIALEWRLDSSRERMTRAWLMASPRRRQMIGALHAWKRLTWRKPLITITHGLLEELVPGAAALSDEEIVGRARKLKEEDDRLKAEARGEPVAEPTEQTDKEVDWRRPFSVSADLWAACEEEWGDDWGGPEVAVCRALERAGPWRTAEVLGALARARGARARAWLHADWGRLRVGLEDEWQGDPAAPEPDDRWSEVPWAEVLDRSGHRLLAA